VGPRAGLDRYDKSRPHWDSIPDRPARSQSLYLLSYRINEVRKTSDGFLFLGTST
jgi:hypothetical protein